MIDAPRVVGDDTICDQCGRPRKAHGENLACPMPRQWYPVQDGETKDEAWAGLDCRFTPDEEIA